MANELINPVVIAQETLLRLENNVILFKHVLRDFDDKFAVPDNKIGYTYNLRIPVRFRGRRGDALQPEDIREIPYPLIVNQLWGQDLDISDQDLTMTIDRFGERYVEPGSEIIANMIDGDGFDQSNNLFSFVGTPGTIPTTLDTYAQTRAVLQNLAVPMNPKAMAMIISPDMEVKALGFQNNLFNPQEEVSKQYLTGTMGTAVGYKWSAAQNVANHTVGLTTGATFQVDGNNQTGSTLNIKTGLGAATQILNAGDIIDVSAMKAINPISYRLVNKNRTLVVTQDVICDGAGKAAVPIAPDIVVDPTSPFQTCNSLPVDGAAINVFGVANANMANISGVVSPQGLAFHRECFALVIARLEKPGGMEWSEEVSNPRVGLSIRLVRGYDIRANRKYTRLDVLGGWATPRPEMGCRVVS